MRRLWECAERALQAYTTFVQKKALGTLMVLMLVMGAHILAICIYGAQGLVHPAVLLHAGMVFAAITCALLVGCVVPLMLRDGIEAWHRYWRRESRDARRARLVRWRGWLASSRSALIPSALLGGVFGALIASLSWEMGHDAFRGVACGLLGALLGGTAGYGVRRWLVRVLDRRIATHDYGTEFLVRLRKRARKHPLSLGEEFPLDPSIMHGLVPHPPVMPDPEDPTGHA
ncbi:magnesium transporter [Candidatus Uhrbacteria bacterium]|nr:magnesium transporter [Candidatus Uhrbacteria bacterium]